MAKQLRLVASGLETESGVIKGEPGIFGGIIVMTDGSNAATAVVYDNESEGSGLVVCKVLVPAVTLARSFTPAVPVVLDEGCYLDLSGTGAVALVYYY